MPRAGVNTALPPTTHPGLKAITIRTGEGYSSTTPSPPLSTTAMASSSSSGAGTYFVESIKISINTLKVVADDLPVPASIILGLISGAIAALETMKSNRELCNELRDRLLRLLPVVMMAIKEGRRGKRSPAATPNDLKQSIEKLQRDLERILQEVEKIKATVKSKRLRRKVAALFFGNVHASALQKCSKDLEWAMNEFQVTSRLGDAVRLCEVLEKTRSILTNQLLHALPRAKYAAFNCERPDKPSNCFEGTRIGILSDIRAWIATQGPGVQRVFWLSGIAGVGKTTVARTIAQHALEEGILGAQFFFSRRGEAELRDPRIVFSTIAYQLARFDPEFGERIIAALEADPDAAFGSLEDQLDKLIIEPLSQVARDPNRVVLIAFDAFDECESNGAKQVLRLLVEGIPRLPFYLKILLTSRPEPHIQSVLIPSNNLHLTALHDIEASIVTGDIHVYLRAQLRKLAADRSHILAPGWITDDEINLLAAKAGNLFIHAATALRFLLNSLDPRRQLDILLRILNSPHPSTETSNPFADLDNLYLEILRGLVNSTNGEEVVAAHQAVLGSIVLLRDPLPIDALERLLGPDSPRASSILPSLNSVILPPTSPNDCPRVYHPSFPDFLQDQNRCTDKRFWIDNKKHEGRMALRCLDLISTALRKGMLGDLDPALLNSNLAGRKSKIRAAFSPELQYACRYWAVHFVAATKGDVNPAMVHSLDYFAAEDLLPWVEVMSWLGELRPCLASLEAIHSWATNNSYLPLTKSLLNDAQRMLLAHFSTINAGAQNITRSVFPFLPQNCHLRTQYPDYVDPTITVLSGIGTDWPACLTVLQSHSEDIRSVAFSPDGSRLASVSDDNTVHICDARGGGSLIVLKGHSECVNCVAFSPNGSQLASGSDDCTIRIWDPLSPDSVNILTEHSNSVMSLSFSFDSSKLASGSGDGTCRIWDASSVCCLLTLQGHSDWVRSVTFSREGLRLATGSDDQTIRVWDANTGDLLTSLHGHSGWVQSVVFFPNGSQLASASNDQTIRIWDVAAGACVTTFEGHSDKIYSMAISPDGTRLACGGPVDWTIRIWDTTNHTCLTTLTGHSNAVLSVSFSPDGSRLASGSGDATVRIWDTSITGSPASVQGHSEIVKSVTFSPDGLHVASGSNDKTVRLWDAVTGGIIASLAGHTDWVESVAFSPDGLLLASGSSDTTLRLWDATTTDCLAIFEDNSDDVYSVTFSPDGSRLASGSRDHSIHIYDVTNQACLAILNGHDYWVRSVAFTPDGARIVSASDDYTVRVWDAVEGTCRKVIKGHMGRVWSVKFSSSGSEIISRSEEGEVRVWNTETGDEVDVSAYEARIRTGRQLIFEGGRLSQIDVSGSRRLLCIVPVSYVVDRVYVTTRTAFFELGPKRTRVALGCADGAVLILEVGLY